MFFDDRNPSHFHAVYGEHEVLIDIQHLAVFAGTLPPRALGLVIEWATLHQRERLDDWMRAREQQSLERIDPL